MTTRKATGIASFNYVMDIILDRDDSSRLKTCLKENGIDDITSLLSLNGKTIDALEYEDSTKTGVMIKPNKGDKNLIRVFLHYIIFLDLAGNPVKGNWTSLKETDFDDFRVSAKYLIFLTSGILPGSTTPSVPLTTKSLTPTATPTTPAALFRRGIKKDPSSFPILKDEKFNDAWHRSFLSQARAQDVSEVLDKNYKAIPPE